MNAPTDTNGDVGSLDQPQATAQPLRSRAFMMLLRREYWEHKGGFLWSPALAGALFLVFAIIGGGVIQQALLQRSPIAITFNGARLSAAGWGRLLMESPDIGGSEMIAGSIRLILAFAMGWPLLVFGIVVFFYLLGALYDERRDRSVLFWKSLPVSDAATVLSKLVMALVVAPLMAIGVGLLTLLGLIGSMYAFMLFNGIPVARLSGMVDLAGVLAIPLAGLPIYVIWALPTAGWLLLCSAWARRAPFLRAVLVPIIAGVLISLFDLLRVFDLPASWFWRHIVARLLGGAWPGSHLWNDAALHSLGNADDLGALLRVVSGADQLTSPALWGGAVAGAMMISLAAYLRRWRDAG